MSLRRCKAKIHTSERKQKGFQEPLDLERAGWRPFVSSRVAFVQHVLLFLAVFLTARSKEAMLTRLQGSIIHARLSAYS